MGYRIFTDATADLSPELLAAMSGVTIIPMDITLGDRGYTYGPEGDITVDDFYAGQRSGLFGSTSQINFSTYSKYFVQALEAGEDVLYLCFSSGLSGTFQAVRLYAEDLRDQYPQRKIVCIDTLCASIGEGLLVAEAARLQAAGMDMEELAQWVADHRLESCHWFTVDTFEHLKHGGRVSAATAAVGSLLQIKLMLRLSETGELAVTEKPRGNRRAMEALLKRMRQGWTPQLSPTVIVGHGDCPDRAEELRRAVQAEFPTAQVTIAPIGPVIGAHTGPGMLALVFWGTER